MNNEYEEKEIEIIREVFNDERKIIGLAPPGVVQIDDDVYQGGLVYITEDDEFIDLEFQDSDYDEDSHLDYIEFAEDLYSKRKKPVRVYVLCNPKIRILIKPYKLYSDADFTIRIAQVQRESHSIIEKIKNKLAK